MRKKVYISGPVTGLDYKAVCFRFATVQRELEMNGYEAFNPCTIKLDKDATHEDYMRADLSVMPSCDLIYFLDGWEKSNGCRAEMHDALQMGLGIRFENHEAYRLTCHSIQSVFDSVLRTLDCVREDILGQRRSRKLTVQRIAIITYMLYNTTVNTIELGRMMNRNHSTIGHLFHQRFKYRDLVEPLLGQLKEELKPQQKEPSPLPLFDGCE